MDIKKNEESSKPINIRSISPTFTLQHLLIYLFQIAFNAASSFLISAISWLCLDTNITKSSFWESPVVCVMGLTSCCHNSHVWDCFFGLFSFVYYNFRLCVLMSLPFFDFIGNFFKAHSLFPFFCGIDLYRFSLFICL